MEFARKGRGNTNNIKRVPENSNANLKVFERTRDWGELFYMLNYLRVRHRTNFSALVITSNTKYRTAIFYYGLLEIRSRVLRMCR